MESNEAKEEPADASATSAATRRPGPDGVRAPREELKWGAGFFGRITPEAFL